MAEFSPLIGNLCYIEGCRTVSTEEEFTMGDKSKGKEKKEKKKKKDKKDKK